MFEQSQLLAVTAVGQLQVEAAERHVRDFPILHNCVALQPAPYVLYVTKKIFVNKRIRY